MSKVFKTGFAIREGTSFRILAFFQAAKGSDWLNALVSTVSPGFNRSYKYEMRISDNRWSFCLCIGLADPTTTNRNIAASSTRTVKH